MADAVFSDYIAILSSVSYVIDLEDLLQYIQDTVLFRHAGLGRVCSDRHRRANKEMALSAVAGACLLSGCRNSVSDQK